MFKKEYFYPFLFCVAMLLWASFGLAGAIQEDPAKVTTAETSHKFGYEEMPLFMEFGYKNGEIDHIYYLCDTANPQNFVDMFRYLDKRQDLPRKIVIEVDNLGGDVYSSLRIANIMFAHWQDYEIVTEVYGIAASMGFIIFNAGEVRVCSPHAEFMWHEVFTEQGSPPVPTSKVNYRTLRDNINSYEHWQSTLHNILVERGNLTKDHIERKLKSNREGWWFNGVKAKSLGFCDSHSVPLTKMPIFIQEKGNE